MILALRPSSQEKLVFHLANISRSASVPHPLKFCGVLNVFLVLRSTLASANQRVSIHQRSPSMRFPDISSFPQKQRKNFFHPELVDKFCALKVVRLRQPQIEQ
jgi:hypothetical protein